MLSWLLRVVCIAAVSFQSIPGQTQEIEWSGWAGIEPRIFFEDPIVDDQPDRGVSPSVVLVPEIRYDWNDGRDRLTAVGFFRYDSDDDNRTHADIRELNWQHFSGPWSLLIGLGKVFWGVTESRHLVDIVNQTDLVEDIDEEEKLGQPMVLLERWNEWGSVGLFVMPGFRERTFPAADARLRGPFPVSSNAVYESSAEDNRVDVALRWSNSLDDWDIGVSGFHGTGREPRLVPVLRAERGLELVPHYDVISQIGVDTQFTRGAWLWKFEGIIRSGQGDDFGALVGGMEYTFYNVGSTNADIGLLAEYLHDGRDGFAPATVLEDDIFFGARYTLNDFDDSNILVGTIIDLDSDEMITLIEAERRVGERWILGVDLRLFSNISDRSKLAGFQQDSYLVLRANWFF
jgi:hypothetical protein